MTSQRAESALWAVREGAAGFICPRIKYGAGSANLGRNYFMASIQTSSSFSHGIINSYNVSF
jgi:hypothetical protein